MAKTAKKNQKFDRNRTRSNSMKMYRAMSRDRINKRRKLAKHVAAHPNDTAGANALKAVTGGGTGPAATFPVIPRYENKHTPDGVNDLELEYRKHRLDYELRGGKRKKRVVLLEPVCTGPVFWVESCGKVLEVSPDLAEADARYTRSRSATHVIRRDGDRVAVLRNKPAVALSRKPLEAVFAG